MRMPFLMFSTATYHPTLREGFQASLHPRCNKHFLSKSSLFHSKVLDMPSVPQARIRLKTEDLEFWDSRGQCLEI